MAPAWTPLLRLPPVALPGSPCGHSQPLSPPSYACLLTLRPLPCGSLCLGHPFSSGLLGQLLNSSAEATCPRQLPLSLVSSLRLRAAHRAGDRGGFSWPGLHRARAPMPISRPHGGTRPPGCCLEALPVTMMKRVQCPPPLPCSAGMGSGASLRGHSVFSLHGTRNAPESEGGSLGLQRSPRPSAHPDFCRASR